MSSQMIITWSAGSSSLSSCLFSNTLYVFPVRACKPKLSLRLVQLTIPSRPESGSDTVTTATTVPSGADSETSAQGSVLFSIIIVITGRVFSMPITVTSITAWATSCGNPPSTASTMMVWLPTGSGPRARTSPVCGSTWSFCVILTFCCPPRRYCTAPFIPRSRSVALSVKMTAPLVVSCVTFTLYLG